MISISQVLQHRAATQPDKIAFTFLLDGENDTEVINYSDLCHRAEQLSTWIRADLKADKGRVLMLFEPGIDYIVALFGIFMADAVAIPSFPPLGKRAIERLTHVAIDAKPDMVIASSRMNTLKEKFLGILGQHHQSVSWIELSEQTDAAESLSAADSPSPSGLALIQYTSGSTAQPKGVMLSHDNLMSNCRAAAQWIGHSDNRVGCSWLPPYHDMGLMGAILQPIHDGFPIVLMAAPQFVQNPARWLKAISTYRATITIAPNFAFDLCVDNIDDDALTGLDLSSIEQVCCGAEPVRHTTLQRFARRFTVCGFQASSFVPCYGLAEATVFVTGKPIGTPPTVLTFDRQQLTAGNLQLANTSAERSTVMVSSGRVAPEHNIAIVNPDNVQAVPDGQIGEIWVQGRNVGMGYWQNPVASKDCFAATLSDRSGTFMRTGDLGALIDGELYVTGRLKDLIIIAGRNHYPQDLELCAQSADTRIRNNGVVALGLNNDEVEKLALVVEIQRHVRMDAEQLNELKGRVISSLVLQHGVNAEHLHFCPVGTIPFTTSGKPQRRLTRRLLLTDQLAQYKPAVVQEPEFI